MGRTWHVGPSFSSANESSHEENRRTNHLGMAGAAGRQHRVRVSGRRDPAGLRRDAAVSRSATCWSATSRAPRTWPTATRAPAGKVGVAIATSGPGATNLVTGIATAMLDSLADRLHHRAGRQQADRHRRVPGDRHHRRHAADHQAQLPGDARRGHRADDPRGVPHRARPAGPGPVLVDITKDAQQASCEFDWDAAEPKLRGYRPDHRAGASRLRSRRSR